jgi:hypothetical protein
VLASYFIFNQDHVKQADLRKMMTAWIGAKDDPILIASNIEEMLAELESEHLARAEDVMEKRVRSYDDIGVALMLPDVCHQISWKNFHFLFDAIQYFLKANDMRLAQHYKHIIVAIGSERREGVTSCTFIHNIILQIYYSIHIIVMGLVQTSAIEDHS